MEKEFDFLPQDMPIDYRACFTLKFADNRAHITGAVAACDALGKVLARVDGIECEPALLMEAALLLSRTQPGIKGLPDSVRRAIESVSGAGRRDAAGY